MLFYQCHTELVEGSKFMVENMDSSPEKLAQNDNSVKLLRGTMPSPLTHAQLQRFLLVARNAAQKGGKKALRYFRRNVPVIKKIDRSPVTRADREAELVIRGVLHEAFP